MNQDFQPNSDIKQNLKIKKPEEYKIDYDEDIKKINYKKENVNNEIINTKIIDLTEDSKKVSSVTNNNETVNESLNLANIENINIKELEQSNFEVEENKQILISLKIPGWIIKSINPPLLKLIKRENSSNNSLFIFEAGPPATVNIVFLRYDEKENVILRQPYSITIIPRKIIQVVDESKSDKNNTDYSVTTNLNNKKKEKEDDYKKTIANQLFEQKRYDEALKRYESLVKEGKADTEIYFKIGIIEKEKADNAKAVEYFKLILKEKDSIYFIDAIIELIKILKDEKKYSEAVDVFYEFALTKKLDNKSAEELYIILSDIYFSMGDYNSASKEYRRFIQRFPDSKYYDKALFYLAYSLESLQYNPEFKEAYRLYKMLIDTYPESKYYNLSKKRIINLERHYLKIN